MSRFLSACTLAASLVAGPAVAECKLALIFAMDISSSVDSVEYRLQMDGLATALESPGVINAILTPEGEHIAVAAYEWSGYQQQDLLTDWVVLDNEASIRGYAARLRAHRRPYAEFATAIGKGIEFGAALMRQAPDCRRRVIDVSGDGQNNDGVGPDYFYAAGLLDGITVNGLVILGAVPDPARYYMRYVVHGEDAFIVQAASFEDYRRAMIEKLLRELQAEMVMGQR
ncbi:MAG: DUF1194 domain-containing protein [Pseudomonadota bacterium]